MYILKPNMEAGRLFSGVNHTGKISVLCVCVFYGSAWAGTVGVDVKCVIFLVYVRNNLQPAE